MIIGITGNSGAGKTSLCNEIVKNYSKGITILDADKIAKELLVPGQEYFNKILTLFGETILDSNGEINRKKLANIIFEDPTKKEKLDEITYKYVVEETKKRANEIEADIIIDAPLLIESRLNEICDVVISVLADKEIKLKRICKRDNLNEEEALLRLNSQKQDEFYIKNSDYVIINNEETDLKKQAQDIIEFLNSNCYNEQIVIIQKNDLRFLQFRRLLKFKNLVHAYTLKPLDFGSNATYKIIEKTVLNNYQTLCEFLKIDYRNITRPNQTHTKNVVNVENEKGIFPEKLIEVDGLVTDKKDKILSLVFADCTPIFLYDKDKKIIGNIHSGWQGTLKKIAKEAIKKMREEFTSNPEDIICLIGPTIRKCHFEVEEDVKNKFVEEFKEICREEEFVTKGKVEEGIQKYNIDTVYLNKKVLLSCGILEENIIDSNICTVCNSNLLHSYRAEKENARRSTSIICKKGDK